MPLAVRQSTFDIQHSPLERSDEWLSLDDAARLLDLHVRTLRFRCAQWAKSGQAQKRPCANGPAVWFVHASVDARLSPCPDASTREQAAGATLLQRFPMHHVQRAHKKAYYLHKWREQCSRGSETLRYGSRRTDRRIAAEIVAEAKREEGDGFKISVRTLQLWKEAYDSIGDDGQMRGLEALVDRYASTAPGADPRAALSPEAVAYFYALYRTTNRRSIVYCHELTLEESRRQGWRWAESANATGSWLQRYDDVAQTFLAHWGKRAFTKRYMPYAAMNWRLVPPGHFYVCDHSQCDFWVSYKDTQIRPWLTAVQDCRSRRIVGWQFGPAPHQESILCALRMAFREAIPKVMRIDNGKDFTAKSIVGLTKAGVREARKESDGVWSHRTLMDCDDLKWKGIAAELGVKLIFAHPYSPWSKGTLERFFRTFEDRFSRDFVTYCGNSPENRPEPLQDIREGRTGRTHGGLEVIDTSDIPTLDEAGAALAEWMRDYEIRPHRGRGVEGTTPREVWNSATTLNKADDASLDLLMSVRGAYKVGANGVSLVVAGGTLGYGATDPALARYKGREVLVAVDPRYPARCLVFDCDTRRLISRPTQNDLLDPDATTDDVREGIAAVARARKDSNRVARNAPRAVRSSVQIINESKRRDRRELRATGTDDASPQANITAVRLGFEGQSMPSVEQRPRRDISRTASALLFLGGPSVPDDVEAPSPRRRMDLSVLAQRVGQCDEGTDAEEPKPKAWDSLMERPHGTDTQ